MKIYVSKGNVDRRGGGICRKKLNSLLSCIEWGNVKSRRERVIGRAGRGGGVAGVIGWGGLCELGGGVGWGSLWGLGGEMVWPGGGWGGGAIIEMLLGRHSECENCLKCEKKEHNLEREAQGRDAGDEHHA